MKRQSQESSQSSESEVRISLSALRASSHEVPGRTLGSSELHSLLQNAGHLPLDACRGLILATSQQSTLMGGAWSVAVVPLWELDTLSARLWAVSCGLGVRADVIL